jgi:exopolysaccharide production protein ExoZ
MHHSPCFEMLFYLAATLAIATRTVVLPLALFFIALTAGAYLRWPIFDFIGNPMIFEFLFGVIVSRLPRDGRVGLPLILGAIGLFAVSPLWIFHGSIATSAASAGYRAIFWGFPSALLVYGALCLEHRFARAAWSLPVLLGDASYSTYLFHIPLVQFSPFAWPVKFAAAMVGGLIAHLLIERRVLSSRPRLHQRHSATTGRIGHIKPGDRLEQGSV